jgi:glycosyltransferase involved in cell wall biosynthesis
MIADMKVVFFQRKPRPNKNFSIENFFNQLRSHLPTHIQSIKYTAQFYSNGLFKRLFIALDSIFHQADVNHVTGDINYAAIFLSSKKTILTILDVGVLDVKKAFSGKIIKLFWLTIPVKKVGYITTISNSAKDEILKLVNTNEEKIRVIYVPISGKFCFKPKAFNKEKPIILQIGTKYNKNLERLSNSLKGISCQLNIVGELSSQQKSILASNQIDYTNVFNLSDEELLKIYENADMLAFVSTYEGFGMPIVEAQMVGRPVITSNILSMPEVAGDGACIVNPKNEEEIRAGILKIINDDEYRQQLIENGRINAKRFEVELISKQYQELYQEIYTKNQKKIIG